MTSVIRRIFKDAPSDVRFSIIGIYVILAVANIAVWVCAWIAFHAHPVLLGTALLAYGFAAVVPVKFVTALALSFALTFVFSILF